MGDGGEHSPTVTTAGPRRDRGAAGSQARNITGYFKGFSSPSVTAKTIARAC